MAYRTDERVFRKIMWRLRAYFSLPHMKTRYEDFGGVDIQYIYDRSKNTEFVGAPLIAIDGVGDRDSNYSSATTEWRQIRGTITIRATDYNGAMVGKANPISSDNMIADDIVQVMLDRDYWQSRGLYAMEFTSGETQTTIDSDQTPIRETVASFTCTYRRWHNGES